jgi:hypothetical protein
MKTNDVIRKYIKSRDGWSNETDRIAAIEFYMAPRGNVWTEIHHVVITHEYSTSTELEIIRVTVKGPRDQVPESPEQVVVNAERVYAS